MPLTDLHHQVIYKDKFAYCAHPHIARLANGDWLMVFNKTIRRPYILHPPEDPHYYNLVMRSTDQGQTWNSPRVAPGYDWHGVECAGLTTLKNGDVLLNQWRFRWYPLEQAKKIQSKTRMTFPQDLIDEMKLSGELETGVIAIKNPNEAAPWARSNGGTYVHRSTDHGLTWDETVEISTSPYSGGYGMRGAVELPNGDILLPLSDVPNYETVFLVRSTDGGRSWGNLTEVARQEGLWFEEPSTLLLPDGRLLMMLRENKTHYLYQTMSADDGWNWSPLQRTPIWGYPAHLLNLSGGRILCVYGHRAKPYGIRAVISYNLGESWDMDHVLVIRDDFPNRDLGYPASLTIEPDRVFSVYYGQVADGTTCIQASTYQIKEYL